jgi:hypothetical protein
MNDRRLPFGEQLERALYLRDGDKYDHRQDPRDVTNHMEADPELRKNMERQGFVVRWAIDGRWRLTDRGAKEMERRRAEIAKARRQNSVGPLLPEHEAALKGEHDE